MRKIDRALLKRTLGGDFPGGPRQSWTLLNEAEGRVYFLGWNVLYQDYSYPLSTASHYPAPAAGCESEKGLVEWHVMLDRVRAGELEACLVLQLPVDPGAQPLQFDRVVDGVYFGEVVQTNSEIWFRADDREPLRSARAPRQQSA